VSGDQHLSSFLAEPTDDLRQGDICFEWAYPKWDLNTYMVATSPTGGNSPAALLALHEKAVPVPIVLCSHDCELENPRNRLGIVVAPVLPWPFADKSDDRSLALINSASPGTDGSYEFIQTYPIRLPTGQPDWRIIDFSGMQSVASPQKVLPILRKAKRFEMVDETRESFSYKLAAFFIR
jgi:hypothetical protein